MFVIVITERDGRIHGGMAQDASVTFGEIKTLFLYHNKSCNNVILCENGSDQVNWKLTLKLRSCLSSIWSRQNGSLF